MPEEISKILGVGRRSIFYWVSRYKRKGVEGLREGRHSGRPRRLNEGQLERLRRILKKDYEDLSRGWTCGRVAEWIRAEFGVKYHRDHVRKILHQLGFTLLRGRGGGIRRINHKSKGETER